MMEQQLEIETHLGAQRQTRQMRVESVAFARECANGCRNILLTNQHIEIGKGPEQGIGVERFGQGRALQWQNGNAFGLECVEQGEELGGEDEVAPGGAAILGAQAAEDVLGHEAGAAVVQGTVEDCSQAVVLRGFDQGIPIGNGLGQRPGALGQTGVGPGAIKQQLLG